MKYKILFLTLLLIFTGCSFNQAKIVSSATILIKTPKMKFYDKGFITKYNNYTKVQILSVGTSILSLKIYDNQICRDTFKCQSLKSFNNEFLHESYNDDFIKELFDSEDKEIIHRDKKNKILIKIKKD